MRHQLWVIDDEATIAALTRAVDALPALYIADGHHRSAAALRVAQARGETDGYFLAVLLPQHEMTILDYNRVLRDLNGLTPERGLAGNRTPLRGRAERSAGPPGRADEVGMVLGGRWRRLTLKPEIAAEAARSGDPVARLPVTLLAKNVIEPIFGIVDPRRDKRIDFVGGGRGLERARAARFLRRDGGRFRALSDADERPHGGRRRRRDHAAEIDLVRTQARRRHGQPHAGLMLRRETSNQRFSPCARGIVSAAR